MKLYYIMADCGDGSARVEWYKSKEKAMALVCDDDYCEEYFLNEGCIGSIEMPDDAVANSTIHFQD